LFYWRFSPVDKLRERFTVHSIYFSTLIAQRVTNSC